MGTNVKAKTAIDRLEMFPIFKEQMLAWERLDDPIWGPSFPDSNDDASLQFFFQMLEELNKGKVVSRKFAESNTDAVLMDRLLNTMRFTTGIKLMRITEIGKFETPDTVNYSNYVGLYHIWLE